MNKILRKFNNQGHKLYEKTPDGAEIWWDSNGNKIHYKSGNIEEWFKYDENNKLIYVINKNGDEEWFKYDENGNEILYKRDTGFKRERVYDDKNNIIYEKITNSDGSIWDETEYENIYED